jgi:ATP/ADP translocase
MDRRELWDLFVAVASIVVGFLTISTQPIAAACLLLYGAVIGYRTQSDWFRSWTEEYSTEFFLFTTVLLVTAMADILGWL